MFWSTDGWMDQLVDWLIDWLFWRSFNGLIYVFTWFFSWSSLYLFDGLLFVWFIAVASLLFLSGEEAIQHLFSRGTHWEFSYIPLVTVLLLYFAMACWSCGPHISAGLVVPMLWVVLFSIQNFYYHLITKIEALQRSWNNFHNFCKLEDANILAR